MKSLCAPTPAGLRIWVREEQGTSGKTLGQYTAWLIQTFYENQVKEEDIVIMGKRMVASQVPGELFEEFKAYLQERRVRQNVFFLDCIHGALAEAQEEQVDAETDTNTEDGTHLSEEAHTPKDDTEPEGEPDGNKGTEESNTEE